MLYNNYVMCYFTLYLIQPAINLKNGICLKARVRDEKTRVVVKILFKF